jgi:hypothetical protein
MHFERHEATNMKRTLRKTTWNPAAISAVMAAFFWSAPIRVLAADLKTETLQRWEEYVKTVDARNQERLAPDAPFLSIDEDQEQSAKLRDGQIIIWPASRHMPLKVESGLIHDWMGAAFIPNTTVRGMFPVVRDYENYKEYYHPNVVHSKLISTTDSKDEFSMVLVNKSVVAKTALDSDYKTTFTQVDAHRWYSVSDATRIQEIAEYDTPSEHMLPRDHGTGLIWRLHSITRFEERDGGVYLELEVVALSRDIPAALRWVVDPIVRRVSRSSLTTSLRQTECAVQKHSASALTSNNKSSPAERPRQTANQ